MPSDGCVDHYIKSVDHLTDVVISAPALSRISQLSYISHNLFVNRPDDPEPRPTTDIRTITIKPKLTTETITTYKAHAAIIIGKKGTIIRNTKAKHSVQIESEDKNNQTVFVIRGPEQNVEEARKEIEVTVRHQPPKSLRGTQYAITTVQNIADLA